MAQEHSFATANPPSISGLPSDLTSFLGREEELARLRDLLRSPHIRLVTITGFGGIGKTRTAIEVVRSMAGEWHRIWFVSLALLTEVQSATSLITREIGLDDIDTVPGRTTRHDLQTGRCLLVIDNFEHLTDAADQVHTLLQSWPLLTVLVTSRTPLHLSGEQLYALPPLPVQTGATGSAVELFIARARSYAHDFTPGAPDLAILQDVCQRLEGIPLAIELAAARITTLSPADMLDNLSSQLSLLTGGPRDAPARQRTLRDTIAWSYDLLSPAEQSFLQVLGVFQGGLTIRAAASVANLLTATAMDYLSALVASSLALPAPTPLTSVMRYRLLDPVREFALECLTASGHTHDLRLAHARFYTAFAEDSLPLYDGPDMPAALRATCAEIDNFRLAIAWSLEHGHREDGVRLAGALWRHWPSQFMGDEDLWNNRLAEGRRWILLALNHTAGLPFDAYREALVGRIYLNAQLGIWDELKHHCEHLFAAAADSNDDYGLYWGALYLWRGTVDLSRPVENIPGQLDYLAGFARRTRQADNQEAGVYLSMGEVLMLTGQVDEAWPIIHRAHDLALQSGNPFYLFTTRRLLGELAITNDNLSLAIVHLQGCVDLQTILGDYFGTQVLTQDFARLAIRVHQPDLALRLLAASYPNSWHQLHGTDPWHEVVVAELRDLVDDEIIERALQSSPPRLEIAFLHDVAADLALAIHLRCDDVQDQPEGIRSPASLTPREADVLRLLAQGNSNRTIAQHLFISERTVENHVQHIFAKLNVTNRAGAAAWAVRHGLA